MKRRHAPELTEVVSPPGPMSDGMWELITDDDDDDHQQRLRQHRIRRSTDAGSVLMCVCVCVCTDRSNEDDDEKRKDGGRRVVPKEAAVGERTVELMKSHQASRHHESPGGNRQQQVEPGKAGDGLSWRRGANLEPRTNRESQTADSSP
ncbi:hypothetical protein F2P81_017901 [Scophthalmus maximus]|uniref:Uncharacterized protein n=1 Tax=Scophthalmus maximus TaxID=52904 RepID=A0A6A4S0Q7_SCOMX|nr:hypothetical protein F2P81_017901 [Scophthalmus maximus]